MVDPNNPCKPKAKEVRVKARPKLVWGDPDVLEECGGTDFPELMRILCLTPEGSKVRETGKVKLWVKNGRLAGCVTYPAKKAVTFFTISDVRDVLAEIEQHVANPELEWRDDTFA